MKKTVYLAGKITGDKYYWTKFYEAARLMEEVGYAVVNPALLPPDAFEWEAYMRMTSAMLDECEIVCFLDDWRESHGAMYERGRAVAKDKTIILYEECCDRWKERVREACEAIREAEEDAS